MATERSLRTRLGSVFGQSHDTATTALVVVGGLALATVAAWIGADVLPRGPLFAGAFTGFAVFLYSRDHRRDVLSTALYALAALIALAPLGYELPYVLGTSDAVAHVLTTTDLLLVVVFLVLAAVPALLGYRLQTGPFLPRVRDRVSSLR